jgi:adenosine deaminase
MSIARSVNRECLRALPKVDLHRHLEGSLRLSTLWEFHRRNKQTLHASFAALKAACTVAPGARPGFAGFLARFPGLRFRYGGADALERIAAEAVADAAADGVVHLELRFSPVFCALRIRPVAGARAPSDLATIAEAERATEAVVRGARAEAARRGISVAFVVTLGRHFGAAFNECAASLLHRPIGRAIAGLDLAGNEAFAAEEFAPFFREWRAAGRGITIHAGEDAAGAGAQNVRAALALGADRIGHGVQAICDAALVALLARKRTVLEMCPTSNIQTRACRSLRAHPAKRLLAAGVRVAIGSDDPAISQTCLSLEYFRAARYCGLSVSELRACAINAARGAFLPDAERAALVKWIVAAWGGAV